jgi:hypothetical protein
MGSRSSSRYKDRRGTESILTGHAPQFVPLRRCRDASPYLARPADSEVMMSLNATAVGKAFPAIRNSPCNTGHQFAVGRGDCCKKGLRAGVRAGCVEDAEFLWETLPCSSAFAAGQVKRQARPEGA